MKANRDSVKKISEQEYAELMRKHMEETYDTTFTVVESIFPKGGFNTGMLKNVLVLKDPNGVVTNVQARLGSPYSYFDDYANCLGANEIQKRIDLSQLNEIGNAHIYAVLSDDNMEAINVDPANVPSVTLVVNIPRAFDESAMECLYDAYSRIYGMGYSDFKLIAWFTDGDAEFDRAAENYRVYGKPDWTHYSGTVYAALNVGTPDLSYDEFRAALVEN